MKKTLIIFSILAMPGILSWTGGYFMWAQDARQLISYFGTLGNLPRGNAGFYRLKWEVFPEASFNSSKGTYLFEFTIRLSDTKSVRTMIPLTFPQGS